jgi:hypothetical protein
MEDGSPVVAWGPVSYPVGHEHEGDPIPYRCFLDLTFLRRGKDPQWTPEAGRPADRSGVFFALGDIPLKAGHRIKMVKGHTGIFETSGSFDEAVTPHQRHHIEVGVSEVAAMRTRAEHAQQGPEPVHALRTTTWDVAV